MCWLQEKMVRPSKSTPLCSCAAHCTVCTTLSLFPFLHLSTSVQTVACTHERGVTRSWCIPIPFYYKDMKIILDSSFFKHGETTTHGGSIWSHSSPIWRDNAWMVLIQFRSDLIVITAMGRPYLCSRELSEEIFGNQSGAGQGRWQWRLGRYVKVDCCIGGLGDWARRGTCV